MCIVQHNQPNWERKYQFLGKLKIISQKNASQAKKKKQNLTVNP